ncbi:MAG TPA: mechanosensitive ion channel domain-containing protein [Kofleriaceae bacterium]|nr:mechanosensitive ion channel domain-containing protein [Kofleriaceae bacterium]
MQDLTWWQGIGLLLAAAVAFVGGHFLGAYLHGVLYRRVLLTAPTTDDRFVHRLGPPIELLVGVLAWQILVSLFSLQPEVLEFCRGVGHVGLLVAIAWGAIRGIDTVFEVLAPRWVPYQRAARSLLPLTRRIAKSVIVAVIAIMVLSRLGFSTGPLLVLFAIVGGALALASVRLIENLLSAYALLGDHGLREGDRVRLDNGVTGVIEAVGLYSTRIRTDASSYLIVPNRQLADAQIERALHRQATASHAAVPPPPSPSPARTTTTTARQLS